MLLTPGDAKSKMCPQSFNLDNRHGGATACCADECMAWRWQHSLSVDNPTRVPGHGRQEITTERGYCGLAGKP